MTLFAVAALSCAIWIYLLGLRGGFWLARERDTERATLPLQDRDWPSVTVVIAARDEALVIGESLATLLRQDYRGPMSIVVVDDHSGDDTAAVARHAVEAAGASQRMTILTAPKLPERWTGKLWALNHGIEHARSLAQPTEYLLLTDADIRFADDTLTELMRRTLRSGLVLTSLMARLRAISAAERALVPAFVFFFQMLYPFSWVNRPDRSTAAAAGGCMLVEMRSLQSAGGIEAIRGELIDDCALARLLKPRGAIWLGLTDRVRSARPYENIGDVARMVRRCAYAQLRYSPWLLAATALTMGVAYFAPPLLTLFGSGMTRLLGASAWLLMAAALQPTLRFYDLSPWRSLWLPVVAGAYLVFTFESAWQHWRGRGGQWKGRVYS